MDLDLRALERRAAETGAWPDRLAIMAAAWRAGRRDAVPIVECFDRRHEKMLVKGGDASGGWQTVLKRGSEATLEVRNDGHLCVPALQWSKRVACNQPALPGMPLGKPCLAAFCRGPACTHLVTHVPIAEPWTHVWQGAGTGERIPCPTCKGCGRVVLGVEQPCHICGGSGTYALSLGDVVDRRRREVEAACLGRPLPRRFVPRPQPHECRQGSMDYVREDVDGGVRIDRSRVRCATCGATWELDRGGDPVRKISG